MFEPYIELYRPFRVKEYAFVSFCSQTSRGGRHLSIYILESVSTERKLSCEGTVLYLIQRLHNYWWDFDYMNQIIQI